MIQTNETHNPELTSWVASANKPDTDFPIQNLPFAIFSCTKSPSPRGGVAIGNQILDLLALSKLDLIEGEAKTALEAAKKNTLNHFMAMEPKFWSALRLALSQCLRKDYSKQSKLESCLVAQTDAQYYLPATIGDYTDFYTSIYHATAVGKQFRPDNPLLPNYKWVPIGYHGRASSIAISGQAFPRPCGQLKSPDDDAPTYGPCKRLDYECEMGIFIGGGNKLGQAIPISHAENHIFGLCLLNDWSARDIQAWEYQPLGPFLAKSFATTLSPWIVTNEALAPFRTPLHRPPDCPEPLPYLSSNPNKQFGSFDIELEVLLETEQSLANNYQAMHLSQSNFKHSIWTAAQMVTHHTVNGCNLKPGDLFGSGTQSGPTPKEAGSLLELSAGGKQAIQLANGESRTFLQDGDEVIMRGWCDLPNAKRIGFGEVRGKVLPSV